MHGLGSNALQQQYYGNFMPIADTAGFYVVMPQGTSASGTTFWNVGFPGTPNVDDVKFLSLLIDTLSNRYPIDKARIYATGMSNGGYMAHLLGLRLNNKIAAIASVAGSIVPSVYVSANAGKAVPAMQIHGTADATVPYDGFAFGVPIDSVVAFWVRNNHCNAIPSQTTLPDVDPSDGCTAEHYIWNGGQTGVTVELYKVNGGAHSWPGAPAVLGVTNQDFSASAEIWRFFRQYSLRQQATGMNNIQPRQLFYVQPNPATDVLHISSTSAGVAIITDLAGKELLRSAQKDIKLSSLPAGIYILKWQSGADEESMRFVKE
jgi:polyhydroxybutyrate depolymerase